VAVGVGLPVLVAEAVGVAVVAAVGVRVGLALGVGEEAAVAVGVAVGEGLGVVADDGVGEGDGVGVASGTTSEQFENSDVSSVERSVAVAVMYFPGSIVSPRLTVKFVAPPPNVGNWLECKNSCPSP
jgi:hypothetical protein